MMDLFEVEGKLLFQESGIPCEEVRLYGECDLSRIQSVSYTHLDVYKRQV